MALVVAAFLAGPAGPARADYIWGGWANAVPPFSTLRHVFPNWVRAPVASFSLYECDDVTCGWCTNGPIVGVTMFNYGTAAGTADIAGMYFQLMCGSKTDSGTIQMTYAGVWTIGGTDYPAWTWAGSLAWGADPCTDCLCSFNLHVYADIGPCPANGATIRIGPGYNPVSNPAWPGGIYDTCGSPGIWDEVVFPVAKTVQYVSKTADRDDAAPGDTISYTIYYGRPGTTALTGITITDTIPNYTHYVAGSGVPSPDVGWDPDVGPPMRLRWSLPGGATAGGPTNEVVFKLTVDWGNQDWFEPGSGDKAAPEGDFLFNAAHMSWTPGTTCDAGRSSSTVATTVRRYLFWMVADNDVLMAPRLGLPDDEITYEVFVRNVSDSKTWWNVKLWDTVPSEIDVWDPGFGFYDPCVGWTITPTGCAAAGPGKMVSGADTLLTWTLDMPPGTTLTVRWKGKLKTSAADGDVATNRLSLRAMGSGMSPPVSGGTGDAANVRLFAHEASIVLRTTFVSFVGWAGDDNAFFGGCLDHTYWISFYPLNRASDFTLYKMWCCNAAPCNVGCAAFAQNGGVSPRIDVYAGSCTGGPAIDWETGCMAERSPARFVPVAYSACALPPMPFNFLHKMVSNSPILWELSTTGPKNSADADTYVGTSNLTFCGYVAYTFLRYGSDVRYMDSLHIVNTDDDASTTVVAFDWNSGSRQWQFYAVKDIYKASQWSFAPPQPALYKHFRIISSATRLIVHKAFVGVGAGGAYNDMGTLAPNRENGNLVNASVPATFYLFAGHLPGVSDVAMIGNTGAKATYEIWRYTPLDTTIPSPYPSNVTSDLVGNAGTWAKIATHTVDAAGPMPGPTGANPHVYGDGYDACCFATQYRLYKVKLTAGGPVQAYCGMSIMDRYSGGSMLHASNPAGAQVGTEFWMHTNLPDHVVAGCGAVMTINVYSAKVNLAVNLTGSDGASATYTTNDVDECVSFRSISVPGKSEVRNWKVSVLPAGNPGDVITQYICCNVAEKFYTAPFLQKGIYYDMLLPPTVYVGQDFWMTVVVMQSGATKEDYCGETVFTSSDPAAWMQWGSMNAGSFVWTSSKACPGTNENGVKVFIQVRFNKIGLQTIVAADKFDGSIVGLATVRVVGADVKLFKEKRLAIAASGDTIEFRICWSNFSTATAAAFVITDGIPVGTSYIPDVLSDSLCAPLANMGHGTDWRAAYSTDVAGPMPGAGSFVTTGGLGPATTRWLRWTVGMIGVNRTGCFCYRLRVD